MPSNTPPPCKLLHTLPSKGPVHICVFNSTSSYLLSSGSSRQISLHNPQSGNLIKQYTGAHAYEVLSISCTKDNQRFASSGGDRNAFVWDVSTGEVVRRLGGHTGKVNVVEWGANDNVLATGSFDTTVRLWDTKSNNKLPIQILDEARDSITSLLIRDHTVTSGCVDGYLRTYDLRMGLLTKDFFDQPITSLTSSKNTPSLILLSVLSVPSSHPSLEPQKAAHHLLDTSNGTILQSYLGHENENYRIKSCFAGSNEEFVLGGDEQGWLRYWDTETGEVVKKLKVGERSVLWCANSGKKGMTVVGNRDGEVKIFEGGGE